MRTIKMDGCASTVKAMEYIRDNGIPMGEILHFDFDSGYICASNESANDIWCTLEEHPVESWHDVFGMKQIMIGNGQWYAYINEKYYYISC